MDENKEIIVLSREQERKLVDTLFDFVVRVSSTCNKCSEEIAILPDMTGLVLDYCVEKYYL